MDRKNSDMEAPPYMHSMQTCVSHVTYSGKRARHGTTECRLTQYPFEREGNKDSVSNDLVKHNTSVISVQRWCI